MPNLLGLVRMQDLDENVVLVNPWDVEERLADGWTVVTEGVL